jgi:O-antigen/teichoic acid export membrane protein
VLGGTGGPFRTALRRNLAANFLAQIWTVVLGLAFVPVFLHLLGAEGYGLVGFAVSLQAMISVLDLGLATTANREFSRTGGRGAGAASGPVMLRTLEWIYFGMGALVALVLVLAAPWLARHWLQGGATSPASVQASLALLGLATGLRWPVGLYTGVLAGLERQVPLNLVVIARATLRNVGAAAVLLLVGGTAVTYFQWLVVVSFFEVAAMGWLAWRNQPERKAWTTARFDRQVLRSFWTFSGELTLISIFAAVLKQLDKVVIARFVPLAALGHYTVAATLSSGLLLCSTPVFAVVFPRFSAVLARGDVSGVALLYHRASRLVATLVAPAAAALILFPEAVLVAWTRSPDVAARASGALSILAFAMLLNACMQVPYALLLAAGLIRISLWINGLGVVILAPLLVIMVRAYGIVGGGSAWAVFNLAYFFVAPTILHRHVLQGQLRRWLLADTLPFFALAGLCYGTAAWLGRDARGEWEPYILLAAATVAYAAVIAVTAGVGAVKLFTAPGHMPTENERVLERANPAAPVSESLRPGAFEGTGGP